MAVYSNFEGLSVEHCWRCDYCNRFQGSRPSTDVKAESMAMAFGWKTGCLAGVARKVDGLP